MRAGVDELSAGRVFAGLGAHPSRQIPRLDIWRLGCASGQHPVLLAALAAHPDVAWAETNGIVSASDQIPNDNFYQAEQDNLRVIRAPSAWDLAAGDGRPIAIIDTGVDLDHPDLVAKIWNNPAEIPGNGLDDDGNGYVDDIHGWNFVSYTPDPQDDQSHGSHVAGIAAASTDNTVGISGISWESPVMPLKVLDNLGQGSYADVAEAMVYAADEGAHVLNLSLGDDEYSQAMADAVAYALGRGCLVVAAAGNDAGAVDFPARLPGVIAVAATNNLDLPASFSNRGPEIDLAAPGLDIFSLSRQGSYFRSSGTSMSAPHVSGVAALAWSLNPSWSADQLAQALFETARDIWAKGEDDLTGWGRLDAYAAVLRAASAGSRRVSLPLVHSWTPPLQRFYYFPMMLSGN